MTVWRDMKTLAELGLLLRVRGGVQALTAHEGEPVFETKWSEEQSRKDCIAKLAVREFVQPGCVLFIEGGSTVAGMIPHLPHARISIVTNSLPVAMKIRASRPNLPVRVVGGWLSVVSGNLAGLEALREIRRLKVDICCLGATGFDTEIGPSDPNPLEIEVKRAFSEIASKTILLLDAKKFGLRSAAVTLHPRRLHALVTDQLPSTPYLTFLEKHQVSLLVCEATVLGK